MTPPPDHSVVDICVVICTYLRNEPLRRLLTTLVDEAARSAAFASLGVAVIDDSPDGQAKAVAAEFEGTFDLGIRYRNTASGNISTARNAAIEEGIEVGDWVMFIDDDCEPAAGWFREMLATQRSTGADLVTGPIRDIAPPGAPGWLTEQPFLNLITDYEDGEEPPYGTTANVLISAGWLRSHPEVRFRSALGKLGGEDMVWFAAAREAGIVHRYCAKGVVKERVPPERAHLRYQLRAKLWFGNTMYVTNFETGESPNRLFLRGAKRAVQAVLRPFASLVKRQPPHLRWAVADVAVGLGLMSGRFGVRIDHH